MGKFDPKWEAIANNQDALNSKKLSDLVTLTPDQLAMLNAAAALGTTFDGTLGSLRSLVDGLTQAGNALTIFGSDVDSQEDGLHGCAHLRRLGRGDR